MAKETLIPLRTPSSESAARIVLSLILLGSFVLKLNHLGHASVKPLDEAYHAIVAANLLKHPLTPTLNDQYFLPSRDTNWENGHVWLHKPPMALWQIALSYALFGVNTWALRFPSALLSTLAVALTYLIGRELMDETAALIAAALQAFNPAIASIVQGYVFSDHVDISLLFWTELSIYFLVRSLRTRKRFDLILCGVAQGLAILSKSYPALIVSGLTIFIWTVRVLFPSPGTPGEGQGEGSSTNEKPRTIGTEPSPHPSPGVPGEGARVAVILGVTLATILPWIAWALLHWPRLFIDENVHMLSHLTQNVESWAAPWDRLVFDFSIRIYYIFYPATWVAIFFGIFIAGRSRNLKLWIVLAWALGVLIPHTLATSKTMTATLIGWPPVWLLLGYLISQAIRGNRFAQVAWFVAMLLAFFIRADEIPNIGWGYAEQTGFAVIMRQHLWVLWHVLATIAIATIAMKFLPRAIHWPIVSIAAILMLLLMIRWWGGDRPIGYINLAWKATQIDKQQPNFQAIGKFARSLPPQAMFLVDEQDHVENKIVQFAADRSCYPVQNLQWEDLGRQIIQAGGLPYLISADEKIDLPVVFEDREEGRTVYACSPGARQAAILSRP